MKRVNWKVVIGVICVPWLAFMVGASYFSYKHKSPVRIENWQSPAAR